MNFEPITVIMHAHNAAAYLERSLPLVLGQDYPCFEVLVVVDNCTDLTVERLEQMEIRWPSLRHITIPTSAWHPDRHRLAVSLGAKVAKYDWVMVLQPEYAPHSTLWLSYMTAAITPQTDIVIGYYNIEDVNGAQERFVTAFEQWLTLPYRQMPSEGSNTLIRRETLLHGVSPTTKSIVSALDKNAAVFRTLPYGNTWWEAQLHNMWQHKRQHSLIFRIMHGLAVWQAWIVVAISTIITWQQHWWIALIIFLAWLSLATTLFAIFCRKVGDRQFCFSFLFRTLCLPLSLGW